MSSVDHNIIRPGAAVGVLGSGQLGRMFAIAARQMGYRVHTFSPDSDTPTGQVADVEVTAAYEDLAAVEKFAAGVSVVTFEFENVPFATTVAAAKAAPVRPGGQVLHTTQHRLREKRFLLASGIPVAPFGEIAAEGDVAAAVKAAGLPGILKTAGWGYDGKGQRKVATAAEVLAAWESLGKQPCVLEGLIDFEMEISVVGARGLDGEIATWDASENRHVNGILDLSIVPAGISAVLAKEADELARAILKKLEVEGVLCVEMFVTKQGRIVVNELAPRPHNSGHWTIDASVTSQFEQQLRAVCGLPLGSTRRTVPAVAMANLLGDVWENGTPGWEAALADGNVKLHLYGKMDARAGRKMGHLTAVGDGRSSAVEAVMAARGRL